MSMGSVLVQPQRIRRARRRPARIAIGAELVVLVGRIAADADAGARIGTLALEILQSTAERLFEERRARMEGAIPRLLAWGRNLLGAVTGTGIDADVTDPRAALQLARGVLNRIADILEQPAAGAIRPHVADLVDIIENQLGLTPQDMLDEVWGIVEQLAVRLLQEEPGESAEARAMRREVARMARRLAAQFRPILSLPRLNPDRITAALVGFLNETQARRFAAKLRCVADGLGAFLDGAIAISELVELEAFAEFRSLGAAAAAANTEQRYLWYTSWLLGADVVLNRERTEITKDGAAIRTGTALEPTDLPEFQPGHDPYYTFESVSLETCETVAYVTVIVRDALQAFLHAISIEEGDVVSNIVNLGFGGFMAVARGHGKQPFLPWWAEHLLFTPLTLLTSLEGLHREGAGGQNARMWLTLAGPDLGEMLWYRYLATRARESILSGITLHNYRRVHPLEKPKNREHTAGFADVFCFLASLIMVACYPRREWGIVNLQGANDEPNWSLIFGWMLAGAVGMTLLGRIVGGLCAAGLARGEIAAKSWATDRPYAIVEHLFAHIAMLYMLNDGSTDGGRYNPDAGGDYDGYPDHESSPYTLPYPSGQSCYVGQSNQGLFSHNFLNGNQVYAYDFSLDQGDVILASRPGTVVGFMDTDPDDQNVNGGNFILVRHDRNDDLDPQGADATHDRGIGGRVDITYALYLHGRQNSVTEFFPGGVIVGARVRRGQPVMRSGSTGISFHNHLHMDVRQQPAGFAYTDGDTVARGNLSEPIPYVFRDVTNILGTDGVCKKLNWYTSSTEQVV
ncbi:hypothetical protein BH23GEM10_BH23GEM10_16620 [soil metagenome]